MTDSKRMLQSLITGDEAITSEEIDRRVSLAKMHQLELSVNKEYIIFQEKLNNICKIDAALEAFDGFLADFIEMLISLPDYIQSIVPTCTPEQYAELQTYIDGQLQRLSQKRLYLSIESTAEAQAAATEAKVESQKKATKLKKKKGGK